MASLASIDFDCNDLSNIVEPDDCDCWDADAELRCWPCYRDGFDVPNPEEPGAEE